MNLIELKKAVSEMHPKMLKMFVRYEWVGCDLWTLEVHEGADHELTGTYVGFSEEQLIDNVLHRNVTSLPIDDVKLMVFDAVASTAKKSFRSLEGDPSCR